MHGSLPFIRGLFHITPRFYSFYAELSRAGQEFVVAYPKCCNGIAANMVLKLPLAALFSAYRC
jgi:hypothetical protein